jgi:acetyltransferase-like isoleucine patch superfamily enzyme
MTKRHVRLPEPAQSDFETFVGEVDDRLASDEDDYEVVRDVLVDLNGDRERYDRWRDGASVSAAERARFRSYDPRNATLESEYYAEVDPEAFERSKPLQWLWRQFDDSPVADNVDLALAFRQTLAKHLFAEAGDGLRLFRGITMTYGHNVTLGDNVVIHDDVHLDDRGQLSVGDRVSMADSTHVYTHSHDVVDQTAVTNYRTVIEDDARLGYDSVVQAGARVGENAMVGSRGLVTADVPAHHVAVGTPAKSVRVKPGWESTAADPEDENVDRREQRALDSTVRVPETERFDEFGRDLRPPDA